MAGAATMYFGDKDIYFAWSDDLIHWTPPPITENGLILFCADREARAADAPVPRARDPEETSGQVNNVVFVEGLVAYPGEWLLYYGQGDAGVGVLHGRGRS